MRHIRHSIYGISCNLYQVLDELVRDSTLRPHYDALKKALSARKGRQLPSASYRLISKEIAKLVEDKKYGIALAYYLCEELQPDALRISTCSKATMKAIKKTLEQSQPLKTSYDTLTKLAAKPAVSGISSSDIRAAERSLRPLMTQDAVFKSWVEAILEILRGYASEEDPAYDWDWTDSNWYNSTIPESLPYPWNASDHVGIDLSGDLCRPSDGWVLFKRELLEIDGSPRRGRSSTELRSGAKYFALYNTHNGVLRLFMYRDVSGAGYPRDNLVVNCSLTYGTGGSSGDVPLHDFFGPVGPIARTSLNPSPTENVIVYSMACIEVGWIVFDVPLSYSTYQDSVDEIWLHVVVQSKDEADITLHGELTTRVPISKDRSIFGFLSSIISKVTGIGESASSIEKAGQKLVSLGNEFTNAGGNGGLLTALGGAMSTSPVGAVISGVIAGTQVIQSLIDFSKAGGVKYAVQKSTLDLQGAITNTSSEQNPLNIAMTRTSAASDSVNFPYFYKCYPYAKLGFFRLDRLPYARIFVGNGLNSSGAYQYFLGAALEQVPLGSLLHVNTKMSGMELSDVNVQLVLEKPFNWSDLDGHFILGGGVVSEIDPKNEQDLAKLRDDYALYSRARTAGYYVDADHERVGPPLVSIFRKTFEPISAYDENLSSYGYGRLLVAHGVNSWLDMENRLNLTANLSICTRLFLRLYTVFKSSNDNQKFEMVTTYEYPRSSIFFKSETFNDFTNRVPWWD